MQNIFLHLSLYSFCVEFPRTTYTQGHCFPFQITHISPPSCFLDLLSLGDAELASNLHLMLTHHLITTTPKMHTIASKQEASKQQQNKEFKLMKKTSKELL